MSASFSKKGSSSSSITIGVSVDSSYPYYEVYWRLPSETTAHTSGWMYRTSDFDYEIEGLQSNRTYVVNIGYGRQYGTTVDYCGAQDLATDSSPTPPSPSVSKWSWSASNGSATANETWNAYCAVVGQGCVADFSYKVWNDLVNKVLAVRSAAGFQWDNTYCSYNDTRIYADDKTLTALKFNSLRYNTYTGWNPVNSGDIVYGSYFTAIANQINAWIDTL